MLYLRGGMNLLSNQKCAISHGQVSLFMQFSTRAAVLFDVLKIKLTLQLSSPNKHHSGVAIIIKESYQILRAVGYVKIQVQVFLMCL